MEKKAADLVVLDLAGKTSYCDAFLVCGAHNPRHVRAIANHLVNILRRDHAVRPLGVEGVENGRWALLDFGDVLVHIFEEPIRKYYNLEGLWVDARRVPLDELGVVIRPPLPDAEEPDPDEPDFDTPDFDPGVGFEGEREEDAAEAEEEDDFYGQAPTP